jgi:hypothetical protein
MTPKAKADELIQKFTGPTMVRDIQSGKWVANLGMARIAATIAVEEIISLKREFLNYESESIFIEYWQSVKRELENS